MGRSAIRTAPRSGRHRHEAGMSTAEYAVGTLGACTVAGVLMHLGAADWFTDILNDIVRRALNPSTLLDLLESPRRFFRYGP